MSITDDIQGETDSDKIKNAAERNSREHVNPFALRMLENARLNRGNHDTT